MSEKQHCCTKSGVPLRKLRTKDEDDNYEKRRKGRNTELETKQTTYDKRMKTKRLYQSPLIRRDEVELEDGFCGSITNDLGQGQTIESASQEFEEVTVSEGFDNTDGTIKWD